MCKTRFNLLGDAAKYAAHPRKMRLLRRPASVVCVVTVTSPLLHWESFECGLQCTQFGVCILAAVVGWLDLAEKWVICSTAEWMCSLSIYCCAAPPSTHLLSLSAMALSLIGRVANETVCGNAREDLQSIALPGRMCPLYSMPVCYYRRCRLFSLCSLCMFSSRGVSFFCPSTATSTQPSSTRRTTSSCLGGLGE